MDKSSFYNPDDGLDYSPIGMFGFIGYQILFSIPCIGFIAICLLAFGGTKNINVRNIARAYFFLFVLVVVSVIALIVCGLYFHLGYIDTILNNMKLPL